MVTIPAGSFARADGRAVELSSFSLSATEVPWALWHAVSNWGQSHGYELRRGSGEAMLPVGDVSWFDAVKWCNALSEMAGRTPVYYTGAEHQHVYRAGEAPLTDACVDWQANGFHLPTEAQWEYACRAGTTTTYYWGNDLSDDHGRDCCWHNNAQTPDGITHPVGELKPNAFGLYDISGNAEEWCWDWYSPQYDVTNLKDPRGPMTGRLRILRGGSVALDSDLGSAARHFTYPSYQVYDLGLRVATTDPSATLPNAVRTAVEAVIAAPLPTAPPATAVADQPLDDAAVAQRLFAEIDLTTAGLEPVRQLYEAQKYGPALDAYRDYFIAKLRKLNVQQAVPLGDAKEAAALMALHPPLAWFGTAAGAKPDLTNCPASYILLGEWKKTHDPRYLKQWFALMADMAQNYKREFDALSPADRSLTPTGFYVSWYWSEGYETSERLKESLQVLGTIVHELPPDQNGTVPARPLALLLTSLVTDHAAAMLKDPRSTIPNQFFNSAYTLVLMGRCLDEFKDASAWQARGAVMMDTSIHRTVQADGGDLEESFNYNMGMVTQIASVEALLGKPTPAWIAPLQQAAIERTRMFAALQYPFGGLPATGTNYVRHPPALWQSAQQRTSWLAEERQRTTNGQGFVDLRDFPDPLAQQVVDVLTDQPHAAAIPFTSVAFPYSGYYALRDGWRWDSRYLWLMAARRGSGHAVENINSIAIAAFGRHLLVDSGPESYGNPDFLPKDQQAYVKPIDDYAHSSLSHNTVIVDGQSQRRLIHGEMSPELRPYDRPIATRWLDTADFNFVEGNYDDGYGNDPATDIRAAHLRQIIFVRSAGLWIVLDRLSANAPHTYTQLWNFPPLIEKDDPNPGFKQDQVAVEPDQQLITTRDPDGPNISLYEFNTEPMTYQTFYGNLQPFRGWYNMGIVGRRYPKTDVHANWKSDGDTLLVTVIVPSATAQSPVRSMSARNDPAKGIRGFDLLLTDGTHLALSAAPKALPLQIEDTSATATALVLVTRPGQPTAGLVTDCSALTLHKKNLDAEAHDFAFKSAADAPAATTPMIRPTTFRWQKTSASLAPSYRPQPASGTP
jgi:formylglycine-generating enzyme required for sulfatase activity